MVSRCLGNLSKSLIGEKLRQWDMVLAQKKFAYNNLVNELMGRTPFQIVDGR